MKVGNIVFAVSQNTAAMVSTKIHTAVKILNHTDCIPLGAGHLQGNSFEFKYMPRERDKMTVIYFC